MTKENPNTTSKIIIPKKGKDSLSDDARKKLLENLENISPEELEAMGNKLEEERNRFDEQIGESIEIGGKPAFRARNGDKKCIIRGNKKCGGDFDEVWNPVDIGGKPVFRARNGYKKYIIRGKEKCGGVFDKIWSIENHKNIGGKPAFKAAKDGKHYVIRGNEIFGGDFVWVGEPVDVGGKPAFIAGIGDNIEFIMRGNEKISEDFNRIIDLKDVRGKPAFEGNKDGKRYKIGF